MRSLEETCMRPIEQLIDTIVPECPQKYCLLKRVCSSMFGSNPRELFQIKCVEILKWELNLDKDEETDISEVWGVWIEQGYAAAFASVYDEFGPDLPIQDMYKTVKEKANESRSRM